MSERAGKAPSVWASHTPSMPIFFHWFCEAAEILDTQKWPSRLEVCQIQVYLVDPGGGFIRNQLKESALGGQHSASFQQKFFPREGRSLLSRSNLQRACIQKEKQKLCVIKSQRIHVPLELAALHWDPSENQKEVRQLATF